MCVIFYSVCVALRLSRFNTNSDEDKDRLFVGLPSPMAAGLLISIVLNDYKFNIFSSEVVSTFFLIFLPLTGLLMVSNIAFPKKTFLNKMKRFNALIVLSIILIAILLHIEIGSFILFYTYLLYAVGKHIVIKFKATL
jgi:CDP-diacylglycerol--serine O-phosphatidyltransferase